jgi:hypothetical protein
MLTAARVGDSIKHERWTDKKAEPTLVIGASIAVVVSGGTVSVFFMAVGGAGVAGWLIDRWMAPSGEKIETGAATVFTNLKPAALAHPKCKVLCGVVETGAEHVFIEEGNASRLRDFTTCPGYISEGSKAPNQVLIGGRRDNRERPGWYTAFLAYQMTVSAASLATSLRTLAAQGFSVSEARKAVTGAYGASSKALELGTGKTPMETGKALLDNFMD